MNSINDSKAYRAKAYKAKAPPSVCEKNYIRGFATLWNVFDYLQHKLKHTTHYSSEELAEYMHTGGINYGEGWSHTFELITPKGNLAKKCFHVYVCRNPNGTYSVDSYIL